MNPFAFGKTVAHAGCTAFFLLFLPVSLAAQPMTLRYHAGASSISDPHGPAANAADQDAECDPTSPSIVITSGTDPSCAATPVTLSAGEWSSYSWSTGETTPTITVTPDVTTTYSVTVVDSYGCTRPQASRTITVTASSLAVSVTQTATTICEGQTATLTANATGGTGNYSYQWFTGTGVIAGATSASYSASTYDAYYVVVTDAGGCSFSTRDHAVGVAVNPTPAGVIYFPPGSFCSGGTNNVVAFPSSGVTYAWTVTNGTLQTPAGNFAAITAGASGNVIIGLTVTNSYGCSWTGTKSIPIVQPPPVPAITASGPVAFCQGDHVTLTAPPGYSYAWRLGSASFGNTQSVMTGVAGSYTVVVTNASGCSTSSQPVAVIVNPVPDATISAQNSVCAGTTSGATSTAGAASYQWSIANGTIIDGQGTNAIHYTAGAAGNVTLTLAVATAQGCGDTKSLTIPIANAQASITPSGPLTICPGGSVTLNANAGASYLWSNNATAQSITVTQAGSYSVRVFDANGCSVQSQPVIVTVASPSATITPSGPTTFCAGGSVTLSAPAGYASYAWSNGASTQSITVNQSNTYSVTVSDASGCTASSSAAVTVNPLPQVNFSNPSIICGTAESGEEIQPLGTGLTYNWSITNGAVTQNAGHRVYFTANAGASQVVLTVTITDANGCSNSGSITLPVHTPSGATITPSGPTTFCAGGNVTLTAPAGMWSYAWSTGATTQSIVVSASNTFSVTVRDANFCSTQSSPVVVTVNPLPTPAITASGPTTFCAGGAVMLNAPAGYSSYLWNTGGTTQSITVSSSNSYSVTVRNGNGCSGTSAPVAVTVRPLPAASVSGTSAICPGGSASISAALTGTAPWTVTWSDNVTQTINSGTTASRSVSPSATKTYTVSSVTDANCSGTSSGSATITVKSLPAAAVSGGGTICPGAPATITAALTGTAPFTVVWSDNVTQTINSGTTASRTVSPAATTTYIVTSVSDASSCGRAGTGSAAVSVNASASITTQPSNVTTTRNTNITLSVVAGGTAPVSYKWFNGNGTAITGATSSSYTTSFSKKGTNTFYVEVWNACNATHVKSNTVTVTVN